eukprot:3884593-Alexandrium_andersonii.AAC.1
MREHRPQALSGKGETAGPPGLGETKKGPKSIRWAICLSEWVQGGIDVPAEGSLASHMLKHEVRTAAAVHCCNCKSIDTSCSRAAMRLSLIHI